MKTQQLEMVNGEVVRFKWKLWTYVGPAPQKFGVERIVIESRDGTRRKIHVATGEVVRGTPAQAVGA